MRFVYQAPLAGRACVSEVAFLHTPPCFSGNSATYNYQETHICAHARTHTHTHTHTRALQNANQENCWEENMLWYCSEGNIYVFSADFRQVINMFLSLWVIFQYVIKGADPCTLTNCSRYEMADEIHPKKERERKRLLQLLNGEPCQHIWILMTNFTFKGCILHWNFVKVHSCWEDKNLDWA